VPGSQNAPSGWRTVIVIAGSSWRKTSAATSRPATTHGALARNVPRPRASASTVASVVTSPQPKSSASARRTDSR
jgi:hypothetical protein